MVKPSRSKAASKAADSVYGHYGHYIITKGPLQGKIVYYDDDDGTKAIVYPGSFLTGGYYSVPRSYLRPVTPEEQADHVLSGAEQLWPHWGRYREVMREVLIENIRSAGADAPPEGEVRDIEQDITAAFQAVLDCKEGSWRRKALIRLLVLAETWVELIDSKAERAKDVALPSPT
jgi:hypothetical protein